ncbi:MAG: DEAD/DEAH box helicase, partial [Betaproteobacteria bacterium]|nr:DEAD/DEAH box helicase [Betaproteobacteria bacterium]
MGYTVPTPIQAQAIPVVLLGDDVMGAAQTGTGKTAGFALPILQRLMVHASSSVSPARHPVRALMLAPTRELADQIYVNVREYAKYTTLRVAVVFGGVDIKPQLASLRQGCEILIATPGRLLDHIEQKSVSLTQVQALVLDEGRLARELAREGLSSDAIHGDKSQQDRLATLEAFKQGKVAVLVATDVAARGLDIAELPAVINFDLPYSPEDYVHRIGRTGRAGASGVALSLMTQTDDRYLSEIEKLTKRKFEVQTLSLPQRSDSAAAQALASSASASIRIPRQRA